MYRTEKYFIFFNEQSWDGTKPSQTADGNVTQTLGLGLPGIHPKGPHTDVCKDLPTKMLNQI